MTDPVRWLSPGGNPPEGARELLREVPLPPRMDSMARARIGQRIAEHAREREPARWSPAMWLAAAFVGAACATGAAFLVGSLRSDGDAPIASPPPPVQKPDAPAQSPTPPEPLRVEEEIVEESRETVEREEQLEERTERIEERTERIEERTERRRVRRARRAPRPAPPPAPALEQEPAAEHGTLSVATVPWTRIYVDGEDIGLTPIVRRRIPAGIHDIRMEAGNGTTLRVRVTVQPNQDTRIMHQLGASGGSVNVLMR